MKAIDWAASARLSSARASDEFVVREYFADESPRVVIVADRRPTIDLAPPPRSRLRKADALAAAVSLIGASAEAARSLLGYLDHELWEPPRSEHHERSWGSDRYTAPAGSLAAGLELLMRQRRDLPTGTFVFVVSDFLEPPPVSNWARLVEQNWDVVPVVVQDTVWERSFPPVAGVVVEFREPDGRRVSVRLNGREAELERERNEQRWRALLDDFAVAGLTPVVIESSEPADVSAAFLRWADARLDRRGGAV